MEFTMWMVALLASVHALDVDHVRSRRSANDADRANVRCDFDSNTACAYLRPNPSSWIVYSGSTPTLGTGPTSAQSGAYYIYYEASEPGEAVATLSTVSLQGTSEPGCLRFFSHMWDDTRSHMGQLEVQVHPVGQSPITMLLLGIESNVNAWIERKVTIWPNMTRPYQIKFIARRGSNFMSDIGLDTIDITPGQCEPRWLEWVNDGLCSVSCGGGKQRQVRTCVPSGCDGPSTREIDCNTQACPGNGNWCEWQDAATCDKTCGNGTLLQIRVCGCPAPTNGGRQCSGLAFRYLGCNLGQCNVNGQWCEWSSWQPCTASCGEGLEKQERVCACPAPSGNGDYCGPNRDNVQSRPCFLRHCPIDGEWGAWGPWDACIKTCEGGTSKRRRECNNPTPMFNGKPCPGLEYDSRSCNPNRCPGPSDCTFENTCAWTSDPTLGGFTVISGKTGSPGTGPTTPNIVNGVEDYDDTGPVAPGHYIYSDATYLINENRMFNDLRSPVALPGQYCLKFSYHMFGSHQGKLEVFIQYLDLSSAPKLLWSQTGNQGDVWKRVELSVPSENDGPAAGQIRVIIRAHKGTGYKSDIGLDEIYLLNGYCVPPEDGQWSEWTAWTTCTKSCLGGTRERSRTCDNPPPRNGGAWCAGRNFERELCNNFECDVEGGWSAWVSGPCEAVCDGIRATVPGTIKQTRTCTQPYPRGRGSYCDTQIAGSEQTVPCSKPCDVNFGWKPWGAWSACTDCGIAACPANCGNLGTRSRSRDCIPPNLGGEPCPVLNQVETKQCDLGRCIGTFAYADQPCCKGADVTQTGTCNLAPSLTAYCALPGADCGCVTETNVVVAPLATYTRLKVPASKCDPNKLCEDVCVPSEPWRPWTLCSKSCNDGVPGRQSRTRSTIANCYTAPACLLSCSDETEVQNCAEWPCQDSFDCSFCSATGETKECALMAALQQNWCDRLGTLQDVCWQLNTGATGTAGTGPSRASQRSYQIPISRAIYGKQGTPLYATTPQTIGTSCDPNQYGLVKNSAGNDFYYFIIRFATRRTITRLTVTISASLGNFEVRGLQYADMQYLDDQFPSGAICCSSTTFGTSAADCDCNIVLTQQFIVIRNTAQFEICSVVARNGGTVVSYANAIRDYVSTDLTTSVLTDGSLSSCQLTTNTDGRPFSSFTLDLGGTFDVQSVALAGKAGALVHVDVHVVRDVRDLQLSPESACVSNIELQASLTGYPCSPGPLSGRYIVIRKHDDTIDIDLCEAQVLAADVCYAFFESSGTTAASALGDMCLSHQAARIDRCMTFEYHMYGSSNGNLEVILETDFIYTTDPVTSKKLIVWRKTGNQGNNWKAAGVNVGIGKPFRVVFRATLTPPGSGDSDIAVDDIRFFDAKCEDVLKTSPVARFTLEAFTTIELPRSTQACPKLT